MINDNCKVNKDDFKDNVISLICSKVINEKTEPFLTFIKWCYKRRYTNLSEEEIKYVRNFCVELSNKEYKSKWNKLRKFASLSISIPFGVGITISLKDLLDIFNEIKKDFDI